MKKITLVVLLLTVSISSAQQLYMEGGKSSTFFDYKNSQGIGLDNLQATSHSFIEFGYRNQLFTKNLNLSLGLNYTGYGAIGSDDEVGNFMEWDVNYVGLNAGLGYNLFHIKKAIFYVKGGMSASVFVQGNQTLNNRIIDLKNSDDFDTILVAMNVGVGFSHPISEDLSFYVQYMYVKSIDIASGNAKLKITSNNMGFGLLVNISKNNQTKKSAIKKTL